MKKIIYYTPAVIFALVSLLDILYFHKEPSPYWLLWPLVLILAGLLLSKGYLKGAVLGLLPSIDYVYTGLQLKNLQLAAGIFASAFYIFAAVYIKRKKNRNKDTIEEGENLIE